MNPLNDSQGEQDTSEILAAGQRLGIEINPPETREWLVAISTAEQQDALGQEKQTGISVIASRCSILTRTTSPISDVWINASAPSAIRRSSQPLQLRAV